MKQVSCGIYFLVSFFILSCKNQKGGVLKNKQIVPDSVKYEFINFFIHTHDTINISYYKFIADRDTAIISFKKEDSIGFINGIVDIDGFTRDDGIFIWKQMDDYNNFILSSSEIKDRTIISPTKWKNLPHDKYWNNIIDKYQTYEFCSLSTPLFSKDLLSVIITLNEYEIRNGRRQITLVYKKTNGKWAKLKQLSNYD